MRNIGFSSGAVAYGDFRTAIRLLSESALPCIELSALRIEEVVPLLTALSKLDLDKYSYISFHAPSAYAAEDEEWLANLLFEKVPVQWPIIMHPDALKNFSLWTRFGSRLAIENMDRRKPIGRSMEELKSIFNLLPDASLCFDIGHARQYDSSMTEAYLILTHFRSRLAEVHISEVNSESQHDSISYGAKLAFQQIARLIPETVPVIIESRISRNRLSEEVALANEALTFTNHSYDT